jgi:hypothetical protein
VPIAAVVDLFYSLSNQALASSSLRPVFHACVLLSLTFIIQVLLYSIQSEVFSLNNMLCSWTIYLAVRCVSSTHAAPLRFGAFFVGLCACI